MTAPADRHPPSPVQPAKGGHYESRFVRGNHPALPLAFWLRHTLRIPRNAAEPPVAEVWALYFDGQRHQIAAARNTWPLELCRCGPRATRWDIGTSRLEPHCTQGQVRAGSTTIAWDLQWQPSPSSAGLGPALLLPACLYGARLPTAKTLALDPLACLAGTLEVNGQHIDVDGWTGSDNHNWGARHSDDYIWAQVCGFDNAPDASFEGLCTRPRIGRLWGPQMTFLLLRLDGRELRFNTIAHALRNRSRRDGLAWHFDARGPEGLRLRGEVTAHPLRTAYLRYLSPCGARQTCANSKLACCTLTLERPGQAPRTLQARHGAALETLSPPQELLGEDG